MGAKDSKPSFISYEDAAKRVSDSELRRIREAFKRCAGANGSTLSLDAFIHEVLCDGVPYEVAEWLYQACGGTKRGITFKDLLCGVVVLTKGNIEEKIKFLWTLYVNNQNENGTYIYKRDFAKALQLENTSLPISESYRTIEILTSLFGNGEKVTFDQFRSWLLIHKDATVLSKWLLSDRTNNIQDLETPTFYQSLAGVTHLEERDIIELEKYFWSLRNSSATGELDAASMRALLCPPLPRAAVEGTFLAFDENRDGHIDFKELCCGLSAACRGPITERLKFCFKIFDLDRDGVLNHKELVDMISILCTVANEAIKNQGSRSSSPDGDSDGGKAFDPDTVLMNLRDKLVSVQGDGRKPVFHLGPNNGEDMVILSERNKADDKERLSLRCSEFLIWAVESAASLVAPFRELVFAVCHVALGLRPHCKHSERDIVLGWVRRESCRGLAVGQFWYLVSAEWWGAWLQHAAAPPHACCRAPRHLPPDALDDHLALCDDSFTTNSTESMGSLLWRAESASLNSAGGSSGVGSTRRTGAPHPGPIDNSRLLAPSGAAGAAGGAGAGGVRTLTGEGGHLRRDVTLAQHRDFELVPDALWRALALWYGAPDPLPRQVIRPPNSDVELELYPLQLKILRHVPNTQRVATTFSSLGAAGAGAGAVAAGAGAGGALYAPAPPERQLAYTAAFSRLATVKQVTEFLCNALGLAREDVRLWALGGALLGGDGNPSGALLLDDERPTLAALHLDERTRLLLEVRNPDLTWPEEIGALGGALGGGGGASRWAERRDTLTAPQLPGATGLHNLGNTCYMNAALQSVWNTGPLAQYFNSGMHLYEVNTSNPLGTKGALAMRFGELCKEVWTSGARSVAPLRVRWCVTRHARALAGGGQHDAQELLAWLLDALHEDLNRAARPAPPPAPAAPPAQQGAADAARPDREAAAEAWAAHAARNDSIMTELFYGQLKSKVRCSACARESVRFDTFNMLSLPLPMESYVRYTVTVILQDGSVPVKYGVRVNSEGTYLDLKKNLSELCGLAPEAMLLVVVADSLIARYLNDAHKVSSAATHLHAYELPHTHHRDHHHHSDHCDDSTHSADSADSGDSCEDVREAMADLEETDSGVTEGSADGLASVSDAEPDVDADADSSAAEGGAGAGGALGGARAGGASGGARAGGASGGERDAARGSVSVARSSLCMPALFCFKQQRPTLQRSRSEILMPPALAAHAAPAQASAALRRAPPALSPRASCPDRMYRLGADSPANDAPEYFVAVHRKQVGSDAYFVPWHRSRAALFGSPLLVGAPRGVTGRRLYAAVWRQLARLLSAPAPPAPANHARDCDDSLAYEFPFTLRLVAAAAGARWCAVCAWPALCRGCALAADDARAARPAGALLAVDWEPPALHVRYQWARARAAVEHGSVRAAGARAVDLASCLRAFTQEERLEQRYRCAACRGAQPATKKLQIWRLPPVLIIHLKRFQYVNNKWIKSHKVVNFPYEDFDPTPYLASVPQETILLHKELKATRRKSSMFVDVDATISETDSDHDDHEDHEDETHETTESIEANERRRNRERTKRESVVRERQRLESTSLTATPVTDDNLVDYHQHHLVADEDPFDLKYNLYAVVSHTGQLSGGHYVAYTRHPSGTWLCYNDSSCRALQPPSPPAPGAPPSPPALDAAAAYLLFYERRGLRAPAYLPRPPDAAHAAHAPPPPALDDDDDLRKMCSLV